MARAELPQALSSCPWGSRLQVAVDAVTSAGIALVSLRGGKVRAEEVGSQLKTSVDLAAEGWVLGLIRGTFPGDRFLAEEAYAERGDWAVDGRPFWTIDALDGTRSYVEGYPGFCVQVALVERGRPVFGIIAEPVAGTCYMAVEGLGGHRLDRAGQVQRLPLRDLQTWPAKPRFVDSTLPGGVLGAFMAERCGEFVECGSVGLKACRVVEGLADVYAKAFRFRLWDVAPAEVLARETGCGVRLWNGDRIDYTGSRIEFSDLLVAPDALLEPLLQRLGAP